MDDIYKILLLLTKRNSFSLTKKAWEKKTINNHEDQSNLSQRYRQITKLLQKYYRIETGDKAKFIHIPFLDTLHYSNKLIDNKILTLLISQGLYICDQTSNKNSAMFLAVGKNKYVFISLIFPKYLSPINETSLSYNLIIDYSKLCLRNKKVNSIWDENQMLQYFTFKFNDVVIQLLQHYSKMHANREHIALNIVSQFNYSKIYKLISNYLCIIAINNKFSNSFYNIIKILDNINICKSYKNYNSKIINSTFSTENYLEGKNDYCNQLFFHNDGKFDFEILLLAIDNLNEYLHSNIKKILSKEFIFKPKEVMEIILDYNIDADVCDDEKNTILHILAKDDSEDKNILQTANLVLSKKKTNINAQNKVGMTPLHYATQNPCRKIKLIELFVKYKANVNSTEFYEYKTPLHLICQQKSHILDSKKVIQILISAGADINARDIYGKTPLYAACTNVEILSEILNHGADINIEYENDKTILDYLKDSHSNYKSYNIVRDHILKLIAAGIPIDKKLEKVFRILEPVGTTYMKQIHVDQYNSFLVADTFLQDCDDELNKMRNILVNNHTSLYDILFKDVNKMTTLVKNQTLINILNDNNFHSEFSNYGFLLELQFKKGFKRMSIMNSAKHRFITIINKNLPDLCLENIFKYLNSKDLEYVLKS